MEDIELIVSRVEVRADMELKPFIWIAFEGQLNGESVRAYMGIRIAPILTIGSASNEFPPHE